jgi:hypothetical protein
MDERMDGWTGGYEGGRIEERTVRAMHKIENCKNVGWGKMTNSRTSSPSKLAPSLDWIEEGKRFTGCFFTFWPQRPKLPLGSSITIGPKVPKTVPLKTPRPVNGVLDEEDEEEREEEGEDEEEVN